MSNINISSSAFSLINIKAQATVVYVTTDTTWNVMTFTITNNTTMPLKLIGGKPVNTHVANGASSFVFDFSAILTETEAVNLKITDSGGQWAALYFPGSAHVPPAWAVAPVSNLTLDIGEKVVFTISNLSCASTETSDNFELYYYNIPGVNDRTFAYTYVVKILAIPSGKPLQLDFGWIDDVHNIGPTFRSNLTENEVLSTPQAPIPVDITYNNQFPIQNGFKIYLKNTSSNPLEPAGTPIGNASFTISFIFSEDADNAITSQANGDLITIGVNSNPSQWTSIQHQAGKPGWKFLPQSSQILFGNETLLFPVGNLITELNVNPSTISTIYIQYNSIPGYEDGFYSLEAEKIIAEAKINSFTISPTSINYGQNVAISWQTEVAWRVTLSYVDRDGGTHFYDSNSNDPTTKISLSQNNFAPNPAPSKELTTFTLTAYDASPDPADQQFQNVNVNEPPAEIESFTATPQLVDINSSNNTTVLAWVVKNQKSVTLQGYGIQTDNNKTVPINQTTTFNLIVSSYGSQHPDIQQNITVYAYKSYSPISVGAAGDGTVFQSLPLSVVNQSASRIYAANAATAATVQINQVTKTTTGDNLAGNIMALSLDQSKLFVAQNNQPPTPSKITMYDAQNPAVSAYVNLPVPPPYCMIVSPDYKYLFMAQQHNLTAVSVFNVNFSANTITYLKDIGVGTSPRAFAFANNNTNLYVANYDSASVSVINVSSLAVAGTIPLGNTEPRGFALVNNNLYVACEGGNQVSVIDTSDITKAPTTITVGARPFSLTLNQNKDRLFVSNFGDNTISVIDTAGGAVIKNLIVGKSPSNAQITQDGTMMMVSNYCDKTLSVVDLTDGQQTVIGTIPLGTTNGNPVTITTFPNINAYTDVFVAKENFTDRNRDCSLPVTDAALNMSILSIQEKTASQGLGAGEQTDAEIEEPIPAPSKEGFWERILTWLLVSVLGWTRKNKNRVNK